MNFFLKNVALDVFYITKKTAWIGHLDHEIFTKMAWFNMTFTLCNYLYNIEVQVDTFETLLVIRLPDFLER